MSCNVHEMLTMDQDMETIHKPLSTFKNNELLLKSNFLNPVHTRTHARTHTHTQPLNKIDKI